MDEMEAAFVVEVANKAIGGKLIAMMHRDSPLHPWVVLFVDKGEEVLTQAQYEYFIQKAEKAGFEVLATEPAITVYIKKEE